MLTICVKKKYAVVLLESNINLVNDWIPNEPPPVWRLLTATHRAWSGKLN